MRKDQFISAFSKPKSLSGIQLDSLTSLVEQHPYSSLVRMLYVKALKNEDDIRFESELRLAAAHSPVRKKLQLWLKSSSELAEPEQLVEAESLSDIKPSQKNREEPEEALIDDVAEDIAESQIETDPQLVALQKQYLTEAIQSSLDMEIEATALNANSDEEIVESPDEEEGIAEELIEEESEQEPSSFLDFISGVAKKNKPNEAAALKDSTVDSRVDQIIEGFIQKERKEKVDFFDPERMAKSSLVDNEEMVTDTLARIYMNQGNYEKALRAYRSLQLKYPEKRVYFATQIEKAESLINKRIR